MSPLPQSLQENLVKEAATKNFGYPLAALVGQEEMFAALIFLAVDPNIGGVLLMGEKGTAKSTAARALAEVTPPFLARDCPFNCRADQVENWCDSCRRSPGPFKMVSPPLKTVPLGVTEERLLGGLDWEKTAKGGKPVVRPGLLGAANNGLIYIDEVNLLEPSLAHLMLDAVSSRKVRVERDSFSLYHPSNVAMLGSMNPEEGPLGPQLADRFALTVRLASEKDPLIRAEIIRRRLEYEQNPKAFVEKYQSQSLNLTERISRARLILPSLSLSSGARIEASRLALVARAAGHRAELALSRAALAACAWELAGSQEAGDLRKSPIGEGLALQVEAMWIDRVQDFIIPQRRRSIPPSRVAIKVTRVKTSERASEQVQTPYVYSSEEKPAEFLSSGLNEDGQMPMTLFEAAQGYDIVTPKMPTEGGAKDKSGRRGYRETLKARGRAYRTTARRLGRPLSLAATLRAAAPYQSLRRQRLEDEKNNDDLILRAADFREKVYRLKTGRLVIFVVDSSGSIGT
ncbi:MAG: ATP-binding protein, partial [Deltaproteobacteria bacterium]|nr:ATP-binding protein [Deltaproteobacteria bacterium]